MQNSSYCLTQIWPKSDLTFCERKLWFLEVCSKCKITQKVRDFPILGPESWKSCKIGPKWTKMDNLSKPVTTVKGIYLPLFAIFHNIQHCEICTFPTDQFLQFRENGEKLHKVVKKMSILSIFTIFDFFVVQLFTNKQIYYILQRLKSEYLFWSTLSPVPQNKIIKSVEPSKHDLLTYNHEIWPQFSQNITKIMKSEDK